MNYGYPIYHVNTANLGLFVKYPIFKDSVYDLDVDLSLHYNLSSHHEGMFGLGWQFSYDSSVYVDEKRNQVLLKTGTGQIIRFKPAQNHNTDDFIELECYHDGFGQLFEHQHMYIYNSHQDNIRYLYLKQASSQIAQLVKVMDKNENSLSIEYNEKQRISHIIDPVGTIIEFFYQDNQCTEIRLANKKSTTITYDNQNRMKQVLNFARINVDFAYDETSRMTSFTIGKKKKTSFSYHGQGHKSMVYQVTDPLSNQETYEMTSHKPTTVKVTNALGLSQFYVSENGLTTKIIDHLGNEKTIKYHNNVPVLIKDKNNQTKHFTYNEKNECVSIRDAKGNTKHYTYNDKGYLATFTDALGNKTEYTYDQHDNPISIKRSDGYEEIYEYNKKGQMIKSQLPLDKTVTYEYDAYSNLVLVKDDIGKVYQAKYDEFGYQRIQVMDPLGNTIHNAFDDLGRLTAINYPNGSDTHYEYNCCSGIATIDILKNTWRYERDLMLNITQEMNPMLKGISYQYDKLGQVIKEVDERGFITSYTYDKKGNISEIRDPLGKVVHYEYDALGNITRITNSNKQAYTFEYNANHLLFKVSAPDGNITTYTYDAMNNLNRVITPKTNKLTYQFDVNGNITEKSINETPTSHLSYDLMGRIKTLKENNQITTYGYDKRSRLTSIDYQGEHQIGMDYDLNDQLISIVFDDKQSLHYTYDEMGNVTRIKWDHYQLDFKYDLANRLVLETLPNGIQSEYEYDYNHRYTKIKHARQQEVLVAFNYQYDDAGNLVEEDYTNSILDKQNLDYNEQVSQIEYDVFNRIIKENDVYYHHDKEGNVIRKEKVDITYFKYNEEGQIIEKQGDGIKTSYRYDFFGNLIEQSISGKKVSHYYDLDGLLLFQKEDEGITKFIYHHDRIKAIIKPSGSVWFYHYDQRANTVLLSDEKGEIKAAYAYLPYGKILKKTETIYNPYTFMGAYGVIDEKDDTYLCRNRLYDAHLGRFMQEDSKGFEDDVNMYLYAKNNPMKYIDPQGTLAFTTAAVIASGLYISYKTYKSFSSSAKSFDKYNEKLSDLQKAKLYYEYQLKEYMAGKTTENKLYQADDMYKKALRDAAKQGSKTATDLMKNHGIPKHGIAMEIVEDIVDYAESKRRCYPPSKK